MDDNFKTLGAEAAEIVEDLRFRLLCQALHSHGPRILTEFLAELSAERSIRTLIEQKIGDYINAGFEAKLIEAHKFGKVPLTLVRYGGEDDR